MLYCFVILSNMVLRVLATQPINCMPACTHMHSRTHRHTQTHTHTGVCMIHYPQRLPGIKNIGTQRECAASMITRKQTGLTEIVNLKSLILFLHDQSPAKTWVTRGSSRDIKDGDSLEPRRISIQMWHELVYHLQTIYKLQPYTLADQFTVKDVCQNRIIS